MRKRRCEWRCVVVAVLFCAAGPAAAWRGEVGGSEVEIGGYLETRQVFRVDRDTPGELNLQLLQLEGRSWWGDRTALAVVASLQHGGPATRETRGGFYEIDEVFQSVSPAVEIEEASLLFDLDSFQVRLGQLVHSWGKLDRHQPNDEINPERFADPILLDEHDRKIGVPSIETTYYLPERNWLPEEGALTFVVVPRYVPFRLPLPGERWFPPNAVPMDTFEVPLEGGGSVAVPLSLEVRNTDLPDFNAESATYAARFTAHWAGADYALYYYHGFQTDPLLRLDAVAEPSAMAPGVTGTTILSPVFNPIDSWGGDLAWTLGRFSFRAEAAFTRNQGFNRDLQTLTDDPALIPAIQRALEELAAGAPAAAVDLGDTFETSDAIQWGVGADTRVSGVDVLFELSQTNVLENHLPLLIEDNETVLLADLRRSFLRDDLTLQLVAVYGASSDYTVLLPRLTYRFHDRVEIRLGYAHIAGNSRSRLGQYKHNDEGYVRLRLYL